MSLLRKRNTYNFPFSASSLRGIKPGDSSQIANQNEQLVSYWLRFQCIIRNKFTFYSDSAEGKKPPKCANNTISSV